MSSYPLYFVSVGGSGISHASSKLYRSKHQPHTFRITWPYAFFDSVSVTNELGLQLRVESRYRRVLIFALIGLVAPIVVSLGPLIQTQKTYKSVSSSDIRV